MLPEHVSLLASAWSCYEEHQLDEAIRLAALVSALSHDNPNSQAALGWFLLENGRQEEAEKALLSAISHRSDLAVAHYYLGTLRMRQRRLDEAKKSLSRALQLDPELDDAAVALAWVLHDMGSFEDATTWARKALLRKTQPDREELLGWLLLRQEQFDEAAGLLKSALTHQPERTSLRCHLATALKALQRMDEAVEVLEEGLALSPNAPDLLLPLGWLQHGRGNLEAARPIAEQLVRQQPDLASAWHLLGVIRYEEMRTGQADRCLALDESKNSLSRALQLDPELDDAAVALAWVLHDMGSFAEATVWARKALAHKSQAEREALLGWLLLCQEAFDEAAGLLQSALIHQPERTLWRCHLATALHALHREHEEIELLRAGLALSPNDPELLLPLGWLHHGRGELGAARRIAEQLVRQQPDLASAWYLLGLIGQEEGDTELAERCFAETQARDDSLFDALLRRAGILCETGRLDEAVATLYLVLRHDPEHSLALTILARGLLALNRLDEARKEIHHLLRQSPHNGQFWQLLAQVLLKKKRRGIARRMLCRARRLSPDDPEIWRVSGWTALEDGDAVLAYESIQRLMKLAPDDPRNDIQAAFVFEFCGDLTAASTHAERAIARLPEEAEAWRVLAKVRYRQHRLQDAESLLHTAQVLDPDSVDIDRQLGWVLMAGHRFEEAESAFDRAIARDAENPASWQEIAEVRRRAGNFSQALASLQVALDLCPEAADAMLLKARILADSGADGLDEAASLCSQLLRDQQEVRGAALLLMRQAAAGNELARTALRTAEIPEYERLYEEALESAQGERGNQLLISLAALAVAQFPENPALATAEFFAHGMDETISTGEIVLYARQWSRQLASMVGCSPPAQMPAWPDHGKLRIAYVAAHYHHSLLAPVLAAHDPGKVEVFLYTDAPCESLGDLGQHIAVLPVRGRSLAESMAANHIDIAVDTVGIHPFMGQLEVLKQFAMRIAPLQCAWLGSWAGSAGIFDVLIADRASLPVSSEALYEEAIIRLPGGQWCWEPPVVSPDPGQVPCLSRDAPTFGSSVRGLRLTRRTLEAWATLLARLPGSSLELIGEHGQDWQSRAEFTAILTSFGVDPQRVRYHPRRTYEEYLAFYRNVDVVLDAFPSNGGLCLIDALWMGVPVVSRAGVLLGERQGLSLLTSVGHPEWAAHSDEAYVDIALKLAANRSELARMRSQLRQELLESPLVDATRVARALEQAFRQKADTGQAGP